MIICSMTTNSHFYRAKVMAQSAKAHHQDAKLVLCLIEKRMLPEARQSPYFDHVLLARQLPVKDFAKYMFMRKVHEASYDLKGHFLKYLLDAFPEENEFVFLDTDAEILSPMEEVSEALERHSIILTPHEIQDAKKSYMLDGIINIGFIAVRRSEETDHFLDWWTDRVDRYGFGDYYAEGVFYEQNWLNLALAYYDIHVLKHPGYNVAYWNLHERGNSIDLQGEKFMVDGRPMRFFHFSHVHAELLQFMNKYITNRNDSMHKLRNRYLSKLRRAGLKKFSKIPWSYDYYASGKAIDPDVRTKYRLQEELQLKYPNPFLHSNAVLTANKTITIVQLVSNAPHAYPLPPFNEGGTEKVVYDLTEELVRRGHKVYLYAPAGSESSARVIPYPSHLGEMDLAGFVAGTIPEQADLIHDHTFSAITRFGKWKIPVVCTNHIVINHQVKHPVYVSARALEVIGKKEGRFVYNGIRPEEYDYSEQKQEYLLFMGRILPDKGVHHAISVAEITGRKLIIAGPVKDEAYFDKELKPRIDGQSNIEYIGAVGGKRKLELLKHAGCLLFPSTYEEPFGLTIIEAMVSGTPVLALRYGAVPEVLSEFPDLICDSVEEMAHKAVNGAFPPSGRLRDCVRNRFSVSQMTNRYMQIYEELCSPQKEERHPGKSRQASANNRKKRIRPLMNKSVPTRRQGRKTL
ncbi:MAG TPA: glycosyltransferase [Paenibacillus sp.]|uniref:glycosyltransferase n=1 Tax=Paenibacillus sp. TaxID=58172 RepID=UPI002BC311C4|nr:glycosyltransferase [Paenibacillus sp.]HUC90527.1 glycosyltransferase [Paenibacillus sp.]